MKDRPISSVSRAFGILEYFGVERRPLAMKDLIQQFGYPLASMSDLLKSLCQLGYLSFHVKSRTYLPNPRLFDLTAWMSNELFGTHAFVDSLKELQKVTGLKIKLGTMDDIEVMLLWLIDSSAMRSGSAHHLLLKSGIGLALLSAEDDGIVEKIYQRTIARGLIDKTKLPLIQVFDRLAQIRLDGYVIDQTSNTNSTVTIAVPAPVYYYNRPLAIGGSGPMETVSQNTTQIVSTLRKFLVQQFEPWRESWVAQPRPFGGASKPMESRVQ